jgi:hypothetical protein
MDLSDTTVEIMNRSLEIVTSGFCCGFIRAIVRSGGAISHFEENPSPKIFLRERSKDRESVRDRE